MAHALDFSNNRANMAYIGDTPWHGLGELMLPDQSVDQWRVAAGLDWEAIKRKVQFLDEHLMLRTGDSNILYRSDTKAELGIVSDDYHVLQPKQVMEFYRDLTAEHGFTLETAGSLHGGKRIWALARTGSDFYVGPNDRVNGYLLLATSFDKSLATRAMFTTVRVVCQNTLSMAYGGKDFISVPHSTIFNERQVKLDLGIYAQSTEQTRLDFQKLANKNISRQDAIDFLLELMAPEVKKEGVSTRKMNQVNEVAQLFAGRGMGSSLEGASGTLWGVLNAVTEYVDHHAGRTANTRMNSAWFGEGAKLKGEAFKKALAFAA